MTGLPLPPLDGPGFAPFGEAVEAEGAASWTINQGFARRWGDLATVDVAREGGCVHVSLATARPRPWPMRIALMERHPLGSQLFFPLQDRPWLVVVCVDPADAASYRAF